MTTYFDPTRPRYDSGIPMLMVDGVTSPGAIPALYIEPFAEGTKLAITVYLPAERHGSFRHHSYTIDPAALAVFMSAWLADPEGVLRDQFKWIPPRASRTPRLSPVVDDDLLNALGLED